MPVNYTSWGQRRALGRRYSIDPALEMERERLAQEYALIPGREQRALQKRQIENQEEAYKDSGKQAITGAVGDLAKLYLMRKMGMFGSKDTPEIQPNPEIQPSTTVASTPDVGSYQITGGAVPAYASEGVSSTGAGLASGGQAFSTQSITPALVDATGTGGGASVATAAGTGASTGAGTAGAELGATTTTGTTTGAAGGMSAAAPIIVLTAAEMGRNRWGGVGKSFEEQDPNEYPWNTPVSGGLAPFGRSMPKDSPGYHYAQAMSGGERVAMAPINYLFGDKKAFDNKAFTDVWHGVKGALTLGQDKHTVLCSELTRQGKLDQYVLDNERKYIDSHVSHQEYIGYRIMADPVVKRMKQSEKLTDFLAPLIRAFAYEMAHRHNKKIKGSILGKVLLFVGLPICRIVYYLNPLRVWAYKMSEVSHG